MRFLIPLFSPSTGTWGGLTRVIAVAEAAKNVGHQVAFCASGYLAQALNRRGYNVYTMPPTTMLGLPAPVSRLLERRSQRMSIPVKPGKSVGNIWVVLGLSGYARASYLRRLVRAEIQAAENFKADRIFTDLDPGAFITSAVTGIPVASSYAYVGTYGSGTLAWEFMRRAVGSVLKSYGLPVMNPAELCFGESVLKIIPSIPELDNTDPALADVLYVGHLIGSIQPSRDVFFQRINGRHNVFVYMGTGSVSLNILQNVLPQVFPTKGDWRCFAGVQGISGSYQSGAVEFHPYIPAEVLLPQCGWTICHGGQNTIIQSLLYGVPLIIFPGPIFERRYNAGKLEEAGAGIMGEVNQFTAEWLRIALTRQKEFASQAVAMGEHIRSYGGPSAAVKAISGWGKSSGS